MSHVSRISPSGLVMYERVELVEVPPSELTGVSVTGVREGGDGYAKDVASLELGAVWDLMQPSLRKSVCASR